ncbi:MAG TPA: vanadium-dependent haloperoxidase [Ktedonobacteraceae bacterium]|nr:vanadium-dependent haloperoxidase [Ktedonobacteraceae bacterium]
MTRYTRRQFLDIAATTTAGGLAFGLFSLTSQKSLADKDYQPSAAYEWLSIALDATATDVIQHGARPTILSRTLAIAMTAMYDAWAAYDDDAVGTQFGRAFRRPQSERTQANKEKAIAYAVYHALADVYPGQVDSFVAQMQQRGFDPYDTSTDPSTPQGVGNITAAAIIAARHQDGANQLGDEAGSNGQPYSDYTGYQPVNPPDQLLDPNRWQQIPFLSATGSITYPNFLTPQWGQVQPFALASSSQFRPGPPPHVDSDELFNEVNQNIAYNASLTIEQKAQVEFMRDGPRSTGQAGHWLTFASAVSQRDQNDLNTDVKLFFAVANVAMDAFIACWETKRYYDTSRPYTLVRYYYKGQQIQGWGGPGQGVITLPAEQWHPYSPFSFPTPPFPGYVSGHSTVSSACATTLALFTKSDTFGYSTTWVAGSITEPAFSCSTIQTHEGEPPPPTDLNCQVTFTFPTFSGLARFAGDSRVMGGYHIQSDNLAGIQLGQNVATYTWPIIRSYFDGSAHD